MVRYIGKKLIWAVVVVLVASFVVFLFADSAPLDILAYFSACKYFWLFPCPVHVDGNVDYRDCYVLAQKFEPDYGWLESFWIHGLRRTPWWYPFQGGRFYAATR